ncbi:NADH-quinone oxidoreductase subunit NuoF [Candidatus Aerophobetes bacterium]|uniref:NADH-quinone oxidoreductase subunit NuoF n=1 Tax=Aerophobetes bacterium TaxID=2030807 RepID=A0A662DCC0_UNCAE|nr:MAG: NADH-quinone oxidoreductase subunit NuoF [Candidatus Aerophobetes bacterium]
MSRKIASLEDLDKLRKEGLKSLYPDRTRIMVGMATCGLASGAKEIFDTLSEIKEKKKVDIKLVSTGCLGYCQKEPLVDMIKPGWPRIIYQEMDREKTFKLVESLTSGNIWKDSILAKLEEDEFLIFGEKRKYYLQDSLFKLNDIPDYHQVPFYRKQLRIATRNCGFIDPTSLAEYVARGGYYSLYKVLTEFEPEQVIEEVIRSGLRGRGGGGFPTGRKWYYCRKAKGDIKYVICNADEGDPGAYMDRSILEGDPHSVIEGMIIGAYAIGAKEGYIYVRAEYPLAVQRLRQAIQQAEEYGLLGKNILGTGFDFPIYINRGGGAFVCGESTALMASIEGRMGEPRAKHIHTVESGLWERPTNLNNVETWANVPVIIARGAKWFSKIGTEKSKGTKVFSVVGKINNSGLVEVPMGITLREIVYEIGGGIPGGKKFKAVQTGGPSGGCVPESMLDLPVDFEELTKVGSMMGSGGMIIMDEDTCMVDVAKYFLSFLQDESCGKCTSCREGIKRMLEILTRITQGKGEEGDIELLEELSEVVKDTSLCALGGTAPNPVLTTIRYFRDEYEAHIKDKRCPARVCRDLITYTIDEEKCTGCMRCLKECPQQAIVGERKKPHHILQEKCIKCGVCYEVCKFDAIKVK